MDMKISKLSLLLLIPLLSCVNTGDQDASNKSLESEQKIAASKSVAFNTLVKGTGGPTVIFESGLGTPLNNWTNIQNSIAANYQTISYDRKGIGGSPAALKPRTLENLVSDLDSLISQNNIDGPIILVGHSLGGHIIRKYQELFPSKIKGLFLIDPTNEYLYEEVFKAMSQSAADSMKAAWDSSFKSGTPGVYAEWKEVYANDLLMRNCPLPTDIPITILASYQANSFLTVENARIKKEQFSAWQKDKPNVKIVNTSNSGHYIHLGEPEWVVQQLEQYLMNLK